ncbi:Putative cryptochrome DASH, mitochondrial [Cytospora mali]|uniref:Cryptochrome DASH n=1 Tax=Cytospora mali TaxID=578113 RepID=A0A194V4Q9_CYTMA|nr:Putative cryptochrome DASH, mitochondrial [Valsa mali var. pyri (nom. inval.)]
MAKSNILIYLLRHDLRLSDNPVFHRLATQADHGFTHLLPVYIFPAQQIQVSGFIKDGSPSPYPEARATVSKVWRTGPHRAKFIAESVWDLKESLESVGSGLIARVGLVSDVVEDLIDGLHQKQEHVGAVWMIGEEGVEERREQDDVSAICEKLGAEFLLWDDEKYYVDDRDVTTPINEIPDVFTTYRKSIEPLKSRPRATLPRPTKGELPPMVEASNIPAQKGPFTMPTQYEEVEEALLSPVKDFLPDLPSYPDGAESAHPFQGGETAAFERLRHLIKEGFMHSYKETRNGLVGSAYSTKLSGFLAQGCITARQVHHELLKYEDGTDPDYEHAKGFKEGENEGTSAVRFELLWRDYMRLCTKKFRHRLFRVEGFRGYESEEGGDASAKKQKWKTANKDDALPDQKPSPEEVAEIIQRFYAGTTGMGLIDASQRELLHTGYTSNRARQNVASFLSKHLGIDWRYGAEWYEMLLVDYDVSSNWANWQYVAGVGNDPRGEARIFNPVKQAFEYDKEGTYVKTWVPEVKSLERYENVFQVSTTPAEELEKADLNENIMVTDPVKRIEYVVEGKPKSSKRPFHRARRARRPAGSGGGHDSSGRPESQTSGEQPASGPSDTSTGNRGAPHRGGRGGRGGGYTYGPPRRGAYPGRGRGYYTGYHPRGGYYPGYHPRGGFQVGYAQPFPAGPPPS